MAVKIRLARRGRKQRPFYHLVVADARAPRDGKFIEQIGSYNPMTSPATIEVDRERAYEWLMDGAQPTHTARAILRFKGVMYKKHLQRGVKKGALTQEAADKLLGEWIDSKESKVAERLAKTLSSKADFHVALSGTSKAPVVETATEEDKDAFRETATEEDKDAFRENVKEEVTEAVVETPVAEVVAETPIVEAVVETPVVEAVEETPAVEAVAETPIVEAVEETPAVEAVAETPVVEAVEETPAAEAVAEAPVVEEKVAEEPTKPAVEE